MKELAAKYAVNILGGDTTRSKIDLILNVAVYGTVAESEMLCRDAAQVGDIVFSTGFLGDSKAGLHLILNDIAADTDEFKALQKSHLLPEPHLHEGRFLAKHNAVHAAIDTSDGLSADLGHVLEESRVGVRLDADEIPLSTNLLKFCERFNFDPLAYALSGGEDYTLLVTAAGESADQIAREFRDRFMRPLYAIGEITDSGQMELAWPDGSIKTITSTGWDHFKE